MTSKRPYLVRALYEWILDNEMTPFLLVAATHPGVAVPQEFVQDGKILLNISPSAVRNLTLGNELIHFDARFGGVARDVDFPVSAVLGIYARENGHGMLFPEEEAAEVEDGHSSDDPDPPKPPRERPSLKIVK